jgi:hypothetical protein
MPACRRFRTHSGRSPARPRRNFRKRNKADSACELSTGTAAPATRLRRARWRGMTFFRRA